jgi:hypothetical protein
MNSVPRPPYFLVGTDLLRQDPDIAVFNAELIVTSAVLMLCARVFSLPSASSCKRISLSVMIVILLESARLAGGEQLQRENGGFAMSRKRRKSPLLRTPMRDAESLRLQ